MTTVQLAFETAILDFKDKLKDQSLYAQILQTTSIEEVYADIAKLQDKQAKAGRLRHLSKIEPFLSRLRDYSGVIETFVQAKPDILALIWGPIKLLLLWADVWKKSFDALVNTLEEMGNQLPDFCELAGLFSDNNHLQELLVLYFRDILDVYLIATNFFSMRRLQIVFEMLWPSHRVQIQVVVKHIASHRDLIRQEIRMEEIRRADELRQRELQHFIQTEENNISQEYTSHRAHTSPKDYDRDIYRFSETVCDGTGKWLFRDPSFQQWLAGKEKEKRILWLRGIPGAGKTLLASSVIKHTQQHGGTHTVFAFLTYLDSSISALSILHSLIFQLSSNSLSLKTMLCQSDLQHLGSDFKVAATLFQSLIQGAGIVRVIVDGLDEIDQAQRSRLIRELVRLSDECEECRILLTSRPESDISDNLEGKTINIQVDQRNAGSIQVYINETMERWLKERDFLSDVRHQLQGWAAPLASRAKGMFLYVNLIFGIIRDINDVGDIRKELENLPLTLEHAYGRVLEKINLSTNPRRKNIARLILGWVGCAPSPMTLREIEQALIVCGPIVEVVNGYVQFVHFTVKEYMFSSKIENSISLRDMALDLAMRCLVYLCQDHHDPNLSEDEIDDNIIWGAYRLHYFSSNYWLDLVNRYLVLSGSTAVPATLINQLKMLVETRSSTDYIKTDQCEENLHPAMIDLKSQDPTLVEMLEKYSKFLVSSSNSDYHLNNPEQWLHTSPLSLPQISTSVYMRIPYLLDQGAFCVESLLDHYGPNSFACGFLGCQYQRYGFETKASRQAHERYHQKPWNCNHAGCQYVAKGFISRKMRDNHLKRAHPRVPGTDSSSLVTPEKFEDEEILPLIFDLVESNQVEIIKSLAPRLDNLPCSVQIELAICAATEGSSAILQLFHDCGLLTRAFVEDGDIKWSKLGEIGEYAVRSGSVSLSKILLDWISTLNLQMPTKRKSEFQFAVKDIATTIIAYKSQDLFDLWKSSLCSGFGIPHANVYVAKAFVYEGTIATTHNIPNCERLLLSFWEEYKILDLLRPNGLNSVLPNIARSSCSINLARYVLDHGSPVDAKAGPTSFTDLHVAARKNTEEAAKFMEFLLLQGADPEKGTLLKRIRDEKGAREISRWLGVNWDELIERSARSRWRNEQDERSG
ncbi:Nacht domain protein [Fusarium beomiforme]|uniref:Nacht domain protein n=1 Tax=Fusarium beomiforme TaxID=44412 RepID=A0A9P5DS14_9HYPO|nr:Nacht domain protein [Fusarium beomiforme]